MHTKQLELCLISLFDHVSSTYLLYIWKTSYTDSVKEAILFRPSQVKHVSIELTWFVYVDQTSST